MATLSITFPTSVARATLRDIPIPLPPDAYTLFCEYEIANNRALDKFKDNKARVNYLLAELWAQARDSKPPSELALECLEKADQMLKTYYRTFIDPAQTSRFKQLKSDILATTQAVDYGGAKLLNFVFEHGFHPLTSGITQDDLWKNMTAAERAIFKERELLNAFHYAMCEALGFKKSERDLAELLNFMPRTTYARLPHSEASKAYWKC